MTKDYSAEVRARICRCDGRNVGACPGVRFTEPERKKRPQCTYRIPYYLKEPHGKNPSTIALCARPREAANGSR